MPAVGEQQVQHQQVQQQQGDGAAAGQGDRGLERSTKRARLHSAPQATEATASSAPAPPGALPDGWRFRPEWAARETPAPAALQHVAAFRSPHQAQHMNCNILCGMEFTRDGMLLAAAGIAKEVRGALWSCWRGAVALWRAPAAVGLHQAGVLLHRPAEGGCQPRRGRGRW